MMFFCPEDYLGLVLMHLPVGVVNVAIGAILKWAGFTELGLALSLVFGWGFVMYEIVERRDLHDKGYQEIKGWLFGIAIAAIVAGIVIAKLNGK